MSSRGRPTEVVIERESKLVESNGIRLPDMAGLVEGATTTDRPLIWIR